MKDDVSFCSATDRLENPSSEATRRVGHGLLWVAVSVAEVEICHVYFGTLAPSPWVEILPKVVDRGTRYLRSA